MPTIPGPAYRIVTRRLVIRCWNPADAPLLSQAIQESREHLLTFMPWAADEPKELQQRIELLRVFRANFDLGKNFVLGVFNPQETAVLGGTGLHPRGAEGGLEIGYWIHKDHINQGLATEISAALTKVAFEINGVKRVEIHMDPRNLASAAVPRKLGYLYEATLRKRMLDSQGLPRDEMVWTLFAEDYPNSPSASTEIEAFDSAGRKII